MVATEAANKDYTDLRERDPSASLTPEELPILPVRGVVVYPMMILPLTIGQPRSVRLIDEVAVRDRMVGLFASREPKVDDPSPDQLYSMGTLAVIHRLIKAPDGTMRVICHGMKRIRIDSWTAVEPFLKAKVSEVPDIRPSNRGRWRWKPSAAVSWTFSAAS